MGNKRKLSTTTPDNNQGAAKKTKHDLIEQAKKEKIGPGVKDTLKQIGKTAKLFTSPFTTISGGLVKKLFRKGSNPSQGKGGLANIKSVDEDFKKSDFYKYAIFSDGAYQKNHEDREAVLDKLGENHGWTLDRDLSHKHASVYTNDSEVVIAYRGTANLTGDLLTDAAIAGGFEAHTGRFKASQKEFLDIASKYADKKITTTGHSLGGSIAKHVQSKYGDIVDQTHLFNAGSGANTAIDNSLNENVHSHHIIGDPISMLGTHNHHNVHVYKPKQANVHSLSNFT